MILEVIIILKGSVHRKGDRSMTKKDYILIAAALHKARHIEHTEGDEYQRGKVAGVYVAAEFIADVLQVGNLKFDRRKFIEYVHTGG